MRKEAWMILIGTIAVVWIIWQAAQQVIGAIAGIGSVVDPRLVNQGGYRRHLMGTIAEVETYDLKRFKERYREECEFKLRYVQTMQAILGKLAGVKIVDEA